MISSSPTYLSVWFCVLYFIVVMQSQHAAANDCKDVWTNCNKYKHHCKNDGRMEIYCKNTCGFCSDICKDTWLNCQEYQVICQTDPRVKSNCKKTCGECSSEKTDLFSSSVANTCKDKWTNCNKHKHHCKTDGRMEIYCKNTCGFCSAANNCMDKWTNCNKHKHHCKTDGRMEIYCKNTCGFCSEKTDLLSSSAIICKDEWTNCTEHKSFCQTDRRMETYCNSSCGFCSPSVLCKDVWTNCTDQKGSCQTDRSMETYCNFTCGFCLRGGNRTELNTPDIICKDLWMNCTDNMRFCKTDPRMEINCNNTCGFCSPAIICQDVWKNCTKHKDACHTDSSVGTNCNFTCGFCFKDDINGNKKKMNSLQPGTPTVMLLYKGSGNKVNGTEKPESEGDDNKTESEAAEKQDNCKDTSWINCEKYKKYCDQDPRVKTNCMKTCGLCSKLLKKEEKPEKSSESDNCKDTSWINCEKYKGYCKSDPRVKTNCIKTCGLCPSLKSGDQGRPKAPTGGISAESGGNIARPNVLFGNMGRPNVPAGNMARPNVPVQYGSVGRFCRDTNLYDCARYRVYCQSDPRIKSNCQKTCGLCPSQGGGNQMFTGYGPSIFTGRKKKRVLKERKARRKRSAALKEIKQRRNKRRAALYKTRSHLDSEEI